ncbi:MAG: DciA family protein [bacterium]|nr:DciA family protein [bacterium]
MQKLSNKDLMYQLNRAGITGAVKASQVMEAAELYIKSELPTINKTDLQPLFLRQGVLMVKSSSPALSQLLKDRERDILEFINQSTGSKVMRIQFKI